MKITNLRTGILRVPLHHPFKTALRTVTHVENIVVELHTDTGHIGYGEAPPTAAITGDTRGSILGALGEYLRPALLGRDLEEFESLQNTVQRSLQKNSSAKAAVDIALWDLFGQSCRLPVYRLLGGGRTTLTTDLTISVNTPEEMAQDAAEAVARGFGCLKIKVGIDPELDVQRLEAVRGAVGAGVSLRVDANQAWTPKQAVALLTRMQERGIGLELVEQPVAAADLGGLAYVTRHAPVPVMADESVFSPMDGLQVLQQRAADLLNIKLMKCGGITNALRLAAAAEVYGVECMMGCMLETKLATNAAVAVACARGVITKVDLDGPGLCSHDPVVGGAVFAGERITVSQGIGLGVTAVEGIDYLSDE